MSRKKGSTSSHPRLPRQRPGPLGGKRDENRKLKQQLLLTTATGLFKKNGMEAVAIDEIVDSAGISKGSFYSYFEGKADLVNVLFSPLRLQFEDAFQKAKSQMNQAQGELALFDAYQNMATAMAQSCLAEPDLILIYIAESRGAPTGARQPILKLSDLITQNALELTEIAQKRGLLRPFDARISSLAVIGAIERLLFEYLRGTFEYHPIELTAALISLVLEGLQSEDFVTS
ncbi:MAG: TetR/AcrR family transcriptional regulator [Pseudobdellovibrionaceae bacterium]|nr:TetR/AcrR family transcriptional regulator [Pseudobdellovibrionaceae bacterium]